MQLIRLVDHRSPKSNISLKSLSTICGFHRMSGDLHCGIHYSESKRYVLITKKDIYKLYM
jgi:hypothetical protein